MYDYRNMKLTAAAFGKGDWVARRNPASGPGQIIDSRGRGSKVQHQVRFGDPDNVYMSPLIVWIKQDDLVAAKAPKAPAPSGPPAKFKKGDRVVTDFSFEGRHHEYVGRVVSVYQNRRSGRGWTYTVAVEPGGSQKVFDEEDLKPAENRPAVTYEPPDVSGLMHDAEELVREIENAGNAQHESNAKRLLREALGTAEGLVRDLKDLTHEV